MTNHTATVVHYNIQGSKATSGASDGDKAAKAKALLEAVIGQIGTGNDGILDTDTDIAGAAAQIAPCPEDLERIQVLRSAQTQRWALGSPPDLDAMAPT